MNNEARILLVEDNEDDAFLLQRAFRAAQLALPIDVAADGRQAMEYLDRCQAGAIAPSLVLLDLQLPFLTGFELLTWIRQQETVRHTPVVILTSSAQPSDIARAYELHANSYLVKPTEMAELTRLAQGIALYWTELNQLPDNAPSSGRDLQPTSTPVE